MKTLQKDIKYIATSEGVDDYFEPTEASYYGRIIASTKTKGKEGF